MWSGKTVAAEIASLIEGGQDGLFEYHYARSQMSDYITGVGHKIVQQGWFETDDLLAMVPFLAFGRVRAGKPSSARNMARRAVSSLARNLCAGLVSTGWIIVARRMM